MAFRATNLIPATEYSEAKRICIQLKTYSQGRSALFAAGTDSSVIIATADNMKSFRDRLNDFKSVPGILQYAKDQEDDQTYDIAAEFNAVIAACDAVITEIVSTLPKDASDWLLVRRINADGSLAYRDFSAAALSTLKSLVDAVDAAIS